jgi:hypothetical protein
VVGGTLSNNKGINKKGGGLSAPALTDKDLEDIRFAAEIEADYVAVSFVRNTRGRPHRRRLLREAGGQGGIVPRSSVPRRWTASTRSSTPPTSSWSRAAIWAWRSATPSCRRYRSA